MTLKAEPCNLTPKPQVVQPSTLKLQPEQGEIDRITVDEPMPFPEDCAEAGLIT